MQQDAVRNRYHQARQAFAQGQYAQAVSHCDALLRALGPRGEVLNLRGLALHAAGQPEAAEASLSAALKQSPRSAGLHLNLGLVDWALARRKQARRHATEAVRLGEAEPAVLHQAARLMRDCGDPGFALRIVGRCVQRHPGFAPAWHLQGSLLLDLGERKDAAEALERAVALDPGLARALRDLVAARGATLDDADLVARLEAIRSGRVPSQDAASAVFCLADLHHRAGQHEEALALYREANERSGQRWDPAAWEHRVARIMEASARPGLLPADDRSDGAHLLFIVGMPRSGTSVLERALEGHPQCLALGESPVMAQLEAALARAGSDPHDPDAAPRLDALRRTALDALPADHARYRVITDKAPMNFERVGFIHRLFPRARFVHCTRAPLDVAWSCYRQDFQGGVPWAFDLDHIAGVLVGESRLMAHWRALLPQHVHELSYERLVAEPEATLRQVSQWLELDFDAAMLETDRAGGAVATASREQARQPLHAGWVGNSAPYRAALEKVAERLRAAGLEPDPSH